MVNMDRHLYGQGTGQGRQALAGVVLDLPQTKDDKDGCHHEA